MILSYRQNLTSLFGGLSGEASNDVASSLLHLKYFQHSEPVEYGVYVVFVFAAYSMQHKGVHIVDSFDIVALKGAWLYVTRGE